MHLLFLGMQKTAMVTSQTWMTGRRKFTSFLQFIQGIPESIETLSLEWCKANQYGSGKFGGKVSENYLADSRISLWYYSQLSDLTEEPMFEEPTEIPPDKWLKKTNIGWLKARGLDHAGLAGKLKEHVEKYMTQEGGPPPIIPPAGGEVRDVEMMFCTLFALISRCMSSVVTHKLIRSVKQHIALFLDCYEILDGKIRDTDAEPGFI